MTRFNDSLALIIRNKEYVPIVVLIGSLVMTDIKSIIEIESKEELFMYILEWLLGYLIVLGIAYLVICCLTKNIIPYEHFRII